MAERMRKVLAEARDALRWESTDKRIRARLGGDTVLDSTDARLVWEPRRYLAQYAVPQADISVPLTPGSSEPAPDDRILWPSVPFAAHTTDGSPLLLAGRAAGFRLADPDLAGYVELAWDDFDAWYEEDDEVRTSPRDPYHRVDTRASTRRVEVRVGDEMVAVSERPTMVFETGLPARAYLPRDDVRASLSPSDTSSGCPYKGMASYWSAAGVTDLAWSYDEPLSDAVDIRGLVSFDDTKSTVTIVNG